MAVKQDCTSSTGHQRQWIQLSLIFPALKQVSTGITPPVQLWKLNFRTCTALKQVCTTSTGLLRPLQDFRGSKNGFIKSSQYLNSLRSCENLISGPSWLWNRPVQPSQNLDGSKSGFIWYSQPISTRPRASHDLYGCENWILRPSKHWNMQACMTSTALPRGSENGFIWPLYIVVQFKFVDFHCHQTGLIHAPQDLHGSEISFL